jgi:tRNA modification GTPase
MFLGDTIVAVSSPAGAGERAILRLSGPRAAAIADRVFAPAAHPNRASPLFRRTEIGDCPYFCAAMTYTARAGRLAPPGTGLSVPAIAYLMRGPRSYTREDVVEFHVGGWPALVGPLVAGLVSAGARPAEPGEFTFRALMGGRLDLAQAEAVAAVIGASSAAALRAAGDLLRGHLSREVEDLAGRVQEALALVEADLDFSDQDIALSPPAEMAARLDGLRRDLAALGRRSRGLETFSGRVRLVIAGRPNAGKSSLFNRLLLEERAIVSPEAGTTRDELRAALHAGGLEFTLTDIAGIGGGALTGPAPCVSGGANDTPALRRGRVNQDDPAAQAQAKALEALGGADLVLLALDATAPSYEGMEELFSLVAAPAVIAITKTDLAPADRAQAWLAAKKGSDLFFAAGIVATSAVTGEGLDDLRSALVRAVAGGAVDRQAAGPVVTARHRAGLERAVGALGRAARQARRGGGAGELVAVELRETLDALGAILGRQVGADVLEAIFSRFCIGK